MRYLLLVALLGGVLPVCAQLREAPKAATAPEKPFIEVTGTASQEVVPDRIFLTIVLKSLPTDKPARPVSQQEPKEGVAKPSCAASWRSRASARRC